MTEYFIVREKLAIDDIGRVRLYRRDDGHPDKEITPDASLRVVRHPPYWFEYGHHGSGPAQLAAAILLDAMEGTAPDAALFAQDHHQQFKEEFIADQNAVSFRITRNTIIRWAAEVATEAAR